MYYIIYLFFGFLGPVSRVAIILTKELQREKKNTEVKRLDKEYLRSVLTEKDAMARSRRSDEVLVYRGTGCAKLLEINLENPGERILAPGFEGKYDLTFNAQCCTFYQAFL